ncbi:MAG: hypothetical protein ACPGES_07680 [Coraliomargarita sp.]
MDWDKCNHLKLNQFQSEAKRWKASGKDQAKASAKKGKRTQAPKRKKKAKR